MEIKLNKMVLIYQMLGQSKTDKMACKDALLIFKAARSIKHHIEDFESLRDEFLQKHEGDSDEVRKCIEEEFSKPIFVDFEKLKEDAFYDFVASNSFTVEQVLFLEEFLKSD